MRESDSDAGPGGDGPLKAGAALAHTLMRQIANGELQSGDRLLPEDELMAHFGVARTTLREALRVLEAQGLIVIRRGRHGGPRVTMPPVETLARGFALRLQLEHTTLGDLDEARQLIEPELAAHLARHGSPQDIDALAKAIETAEQAAGRGDRAAFGAAAAQVHMVIAERGGNRTLALVALMLHDLVQRYYAFAARRSDRALMGRAVRSYKRLLALIEAGDADGALDHWRKQISFTSQRTDRDRLLDVFEDEAF
jgi:GntR family transcriptional repressor for pyruvate dehydrogenase complex